MTRKYSTVALSIVQLYVQSKDGNCTTTVVWLPWYFVAFCILSVGFLVQLYLVVYSIVLGSTTSKYVYYNIIQSLLLGSVLGKMSAYKDAR